MSKLILILLLVCFIGCGKPMTNQEIIDTRNLCLKNGMNYVFNTNLGGSITKIICWGELK